MASTALEDIKIHTRYKLSGLWASVMFCYVYGDYFGLYTPGKLQQMLMGRMEPLGPATQGVLVGTAMMMAIPALMVFLCLALRPGIARWLNILLGIAYSGIVLLTLPGAWHFYVLLGIIEVTLALLIVRYAWAWPRVHSDGSVHGFEAT